MTPKAWSYTSLEDFINCPRAYHAKRIAKTVEDVMGEEAIWGQKVHKHFEDRVLTKRPLPDVLKDHEPLMVKLTGLPGERHAERKIALNNKLEPCAFFARD